MGQLSFGHEDLFFTGHMDGKLILKVGYMTSTFISGGNVKIIGDRSAGQKI
jgi:hypothetical protein